VGLVYAFLLLPMVIVVLAAFNAGNYFTFPPQGFSLKWFANFFQRREFMQALWLSAELAVWTALASTVIGTAAAIPLVRGRFRGRDLLNAFVTSPLLLPQILTGVALLQFYTLFKMQASYAALLIGHIVVTTPYVIRTVTATLTHFDMALEEAAQSLGAHPVRAFFEVTLGVIKPGVVAGAIFAFAISFDNFTLSLFLTSSKLTPLPIELFAYLKYSFDPTARRGVRLRHRGGPGARPGHRALHGARGVHGVLMRSTDATGRGRRSRAWPSGLDPGHRRRRQPVPGAAQHAPALPPGRGVPLDGRGRAGRRRPGGGGLQHGRPLVGQERLTDPRPWRSPSP
jgi:putative spermidine/putrescine transport system permease protein